MTQKATSILWKSPFRAYLLLLVIGVVVWADAIHSGYIHLDSPWLVIENPVLATGSFDTLPQIFIDMSFSGRIDLGAEYLPIRDISVLLDFAIFGDKWQWHHFTNVALYLLSCLLLLRIFAEFFGKTTKAWIVGLLFCIHPLHIESVIWLASRKDVLQQVGQSVG